MKPENLFEQYQPLEGSREHQEQIERQMEKAKRSNNRFPLGRKLTYSFALVATLVFFALFTLGSLSWGPGTSGNGTTPREVEYDPRLGDVTITEMTFEGGNEDVSITGSYYHKAHWYEDKEGVIDSDGFSNGKLIFEYNEELLGQQVEISIDTGGSSSTTNMNPLTEQIRTSYLNSVSLDEDRPIEVKIKIGEQDEKTFTVDKNISETKFNVAKDIPLSTLEEYSKGARAIDDQFYVGMSLKNWYTAWFLGFGRITDGVIADLIYFPKEKVASMMLGFVDVEKDDLIEVRAVSDRGEEIILEEEKKVSEWTDHYSNGSLDVNSQEHFPYPGRWEIQGYVNGEQVGAVGLELVPVY